MGQNASSQIHDIMPPFITSLLQDDLTSNSVISAEIQSMTYEDFLKYLGDLNTLSKKALDSSGNQLIFAVKKGSDSTLFWKATIQIACCKIDSETRKIITFRLLHLNEFVKVFKTLKCQHVAAQQSKRCDQGSKPANYITASAFFTKLDEVAKGGSSSTDNTECCICLERQPEVSLPCTHMYCLPCIEQWNQVHDTCPICRETLDSTDDSWVLSEVPKAEEISEEIRASLMDLANEKPPPCSPF